MTAHGSLDALELRRPVWFIRRVSSEIRIARAMSCVSMEGTTTGNVASTTSRKTPTAAK